MFREIGGVCSGSEVARGPLSGQRRRASSFSSTNLWAVRRAWAPVGALRAPFDELRARHSPTAQHAADTIASWAVRQKRPLAKPTHVSPRPAVAAWLRSDCRRRLRSAFFGLRPGGRGDGRQGTFFGGTSREPLNLVVITLDTTRADRMGAYGNGNVETPAFDRLAREGVLFEQAVSVAPLTLPVHSSMFTGKFPPEHGVRDNGGFFLGPEQVTLAEVFKARGYRTGGFVGAYVLDSKWGIGQGFDTYHDKFDLSESRGVSLAAIQRPANEVVDQALPWLDAGRRQPFFAWLHLYDAHSPYRPPEPFASRYKGHPYNGEIAFTDSQVARVIAELEALGVYDRTIVVVMGDHGESLGDHGEAAHGFFIYNSVVNVPFVVRAPFSRDAGPAGRRSRSARWT